MPRQVTLRQIEAFKALIEHGTVSRAAEMLSVSQPAMSKAIAHLEFDTGLKLFDRLKGRLAPTAHAMQLYEEIDRIFAGVRQVESAVDAIRRQEQGRLTVGVMPAFAGSFIQRSTMSFLRRREGVFCSVQSLGSQWIVDWLVTRRLDVGLVEPGLTNPYVLFEPLMEHSLVCIMPKGHDLADKKVIKPDHLDGVPFVTLNPDSFTGSRIERMFEGYGVRPRVMLIANVSTTLCEFVAAGLGAALVHPLLLSGMEDRLIVRRFEPEISFNFQLCRNVESRNSLLVDEYADELRTTAALISHSVMQ